MANRNQKKIRKIKKNHSWVSIIFLMISNALVVASIAAFVLIIAHFFIKSKSNAECDAIKYMASIYDNWESDEDDNKAAIYKLLDASGRDYVIRDASGTIIHKNGEATFSDKGYKMYSHTTIIDEEDESGLTVSVNSADDNNSGVNVSVNMPDSVNESEDINTPVVINYMDNISIYEDSKYDYLDIVEGEVRPDFKSLSALLYPMTNVDFEEDMSEEEIDGLIDDEIDKTVETTKALQGEDDNAMVHLPFWIAVKVNEGSEELIAKAYINFAYDDFEYFTIFVVFVCMIAFIIFVVMLINIIINIVNQRKTVRLLFTDIVTGGHNWTWFLYKGEPFLRKGSTSRHTYAVINLVFVKYRNYCVCHSIEQGERMLKKVYYLINRHLNKKEMIAHVSNSNFALLLKYDDVDRLKMRLQSLILELEKIDPEHVFSFQAGVAPVEVIRNEKGRVLRRKRLDLEVVYNNACTARGTLADSDESGVALFDTKLVEDQKWIDKVTERQRYAIEHEEFMVYYQPKYDPSTNKLKGAEALIRWQNEDMGFVPPGRFIPIFEKSGFITEIDHYMLEHVAKDQKAWLDKGCKCVPVSVNVSRAHFIESDLAEQIRDIVDKAGTPHEYIEIELTESAFFDDKKALISTITRLKEYGFSVSMDDFGSGYSSLNSLKDMPLDVLKLDAEFFRGENQGERGEIVVSEAIKLAKSLNMRTVAEGVEVKEQVDFLAKQGCDMIQGYYFAKPMPKEDYEKRM